MDAPSFRAPTNLTAGPSASTNKRGFRPELGQIVAAIMVSIVVVLVVVVMVTSGGTNEVAPYDPDNASEARAQCEDLVSDSLKAPSTADFGEITATRSGAEWIVTGYVDAENSFGAMLRTDFQCTVRVTDGVIERRLDSIG